MEPRAAATSIDHAAGGFLRHRFMRALGASWNVIVVFGMLGLIIWAFFQDDSDYAALGPAALLAFPIVLVIFIFPIIVTAGASGAVTDAIHRRLIAFFVLIVAALVIVGGPVAIVGAIGELTGLMAPSQTADETTTTWQNWVLVVVLVLSTLVALEAFGWAWWQLTTSKEGFMAARGWRPPVWAPFSTYRRHLGLPPFIAQFGRGRVSLTFLYFIVALLNTGLILAMSIPILLFMDAEDREGAGFFLTIGIMLVLIVLNLLGVGNFFDRVADARATQLYQRVRDWDARAPIVFLRAFDQDDAKLPAMTRDPFVKMPAGVGAAKTLDEILLEHASPYGPVIAIGDPRDPTPPLGAARVFAPGDDSNWQTIVSQLVGASKTVVMCPTTSAGVRWELELLSRMGAEQRTIFLANPEISEAETEPLFATLFVGTAFPEVKRGQTPIAAYQDAKRGWRLLTAKRRNVQTYTIALNIALQAMHGREGVPAVKAKKPKR